jgi:hypothetical protein
VGGLGRCGGIPHVGYHVLGKHASFPR